MSDPPPTLDPMPTDTPDPHANCPRCDCVHKTSHCKHAHNAWG